MSLGFSVTPVSRVQKCLRVFVGDYLATLQHLSQRRTTKKIADIELESPLNFTKRLTYNGILLQLTLNTLHIKCANRSINPFERKKEIEKN